MSRPRCYGRGGCGPAAAQDKIRIGLIYTLSGPPAVLGQQSRYGFELALKDLGGKIGGKDVELFVVDDELNRTSQSRRSKNCPSATK